jgi:hypothetical protein
MKKKTTMTLEEAIAYNKLVGNIQSYNHTRTEKEEIKKAVYTYNYRIDWYSTKEIIEELKEAVQKTGDNFNKLDIRFETIEDYVTTGRSTTYRPKFNAWSERYVYVRRYYDSYTSVVAIERNPCDNLNEAIGGG